MSGGRAHPVWPPQGETRPIWMIGSDEKPKGRAVSPQRRQPLMATSSLEPTTERRGSQQDALLRLPQCSSLRKFFRN
ncbi:hypothetical protein DIPPA_11299 [Diplonema papillatum]|nr:hypothetical protein DIPPA_11299 [Diplonema papillatum]